MAGWRSYGQLTCRPLIAILILFGCMPANSAPTNRSYFRAGLRNSDNRPIAAHHVQKLLESLRQKTGLLDLKFDAEGFLNIGDINHIQGGSPTARALILALMESGNCFKLENYNHSASVAFAQIDLSETYQGPDGVRHRVFELRVDFDDYAGLMGETEAVSSFDPAIGVFHELSHAVLGLRDQVSKDDLLGDCERHVNQIRRELGLPERQNYSAVVTRTRLPGNSYDSNRAELRFVRPGKGNRTKRFILFYDAEKISKKTTYQGTTSEATSSRNRYFLSPA